MFVILCEDKVTGDRLYYRPSHNGQHALTRVGIMAHPFPIQPVRVLAKLTPILPLYKLSIANFPFTE